MRCCDVDSLRGLVRVRQEAQIGAVQRSKTAPVRALDTAKRAGNETVRGFLWDRTPLRRRSGLPNAPLTRTVVLRRRAESDRGTTLQARCLPRELPGQGYISAAGEREGSSRRATGRSRKVRGGHGRRKISCVPTRRQTTWASPGLISSPYPNVATPSGAQVISKTPDAPWTLLTRRLFRN